MGLLDKLWDDTVAGPRPETGLGKLRKYDSIPATRSAPICSDDDDVTVPGAIPITRSITILRPKLNITESSSGPSSPAGSSDPGSPASPVTPREDFKRLTRRKSMPAEAYQRAEPRNPTVYDWVVISALDR